MIKYKMPCGTITQINTNDNFANYIVGDKEKIDKITFGDLEQVSLNNLDYSIIPKETAEKEIKNTNSILSMMEKRTKNIKTPEEIEKYIDGFSQDTIDKRNSLSFINVKTLEEGEMWYRNNFPKLPDELCSVMARWNWGDLNQLTKKKVKNDKKKLQSGKVKRDEYYGMKLEKGNFVIKFD